MTEGNGVSKDLKRVRGVYEKIPGSGVYWIRYTDADGKLRREKVGTKSAARALVEKRRTAVREGIKLPKNFRARPVSFGELCDDYLAYVRKRSGGDEGSGKDPDEYRIATLRDAFGSKPANIPIAELRDWFGGQSWEPGTFNRSRTVLALIFKLGIENQKIEANPAKLLKRRREPDGRVRFLNQHEPDEEVRLRAAIAERFPEHMDELDIALNTGMRRSEQYLRIDWPCVDLLRRDLYVPKTKNGASRHIPLNPEAVSAFKNLFARTKGKGPIFATKRGREPKPLLGPRHWFEDAMTDAKVKKLTWHDLRHTFASRLVMAGVDLRTVAELMGHKKIQMTMRYAHLAPAHKLAAVQRLSSYNAGVEHQVEVVSNQLPSSDSFNSYRTLENGATQSRESNGTAILKTARATDTRTDTRQNPPLMIASGNVH
jgi:integrase